MKRRERNNGLMRPEDQALDLLRREVDSLDKMQRLRSSWNRISEEATRKPLYSEEELFSLTGRKYRHRTLLPAYQIIAYAAVAVIAIIILVVPSQAILVGAGTSRADILYSISQILLAI